MFRVLSRFHETRGSRIDDRGWQRHCELETRRFRSMLSRYAWYELITLYNLTTRRPVLSGTVSWKSTCPRPKKPNPDRSRSASIKLTQPAGHKKEGSHEASLFFMNLDRRSPAAACTDAGHFSRSAQAPCVRSYERAGPVRAVQSAARTDQKAKRAPDVLAPFFVRIRSAL
jgi:hypothetical protein